MNESKSRLVIEISSENAKRNTAAINAELKKLENEGNNASNSVKKLGGDLNAQSGKFHTFKSSVSELARSVNTSFAGMAGTIVGTIGSAVTLGAITALVVQTARAASEIEKFAYLSGTTTIEFQEWSAGARAMGVDMDKLSSIFKDTRDRIGEFTQEGSGELTKFFTEIAVKTEGGKKGALELANAMRELSGPNALLLYVSKLEEAGIAQNEFVTYMESVGDEATLLIPLLENGGEGFELWADAARNAGAIMDEETLAAAHRLSAGTELLQMQIAGLKNQFIAGLLPALNQIAASFLETSNEGVRLNSVAESVGNTLIWLTKVGTGVAAVFDIVGKTVGGTAAALADEGVTHQMVLDDLSKTIDVWGNKFEKLNNKASSNELVESLAKVQARANDASKATATSSANTKAMKKALDGAGESSKKVADNTARIKREAERAAEEVRRIVYEYSSGEDRKRLDLEKEIAHLRKNGMNEYIPLAKARYDEETKLIKMKYEYDVAEHLMTEKQKIQFSANIREQEIKADSLLTNEQRTEKLKSLNETFTKEMALEELAKEERIFQMQQGLMHANDRSQKYWDLERDRIALSTQDLAERNRKIAIANELQAEEKRSNLNNAVQQWGRTQADMTGTGEQFQLEQTKQDRLGESQGLFDAQMALAETAEQREAIWQAHHERMSVIEADYQARSIGLQASQAAQFAGIMQGMVSESSTAHAALGAIQKGAALFSTAMNSYTAISAAWASAPFPYNLPAVGMATLETGLLQSAVSALSPQGYANGGYTGAGGKYDVAGLVHKGEVVFSQDDVKRNGGVAAVEAMRLSRDSNRVGNGQLNAINNGGAIQAKQQAQANAQQPQQSSPQLNQVINNVVNWDDVPSVMAGQAGQKVTLNIIKKNRTQIKAMLA